MAWTAPMTATEGATWTSAQWNTHVKANLEATEPGVTTAALQYCVSTGVNAIAARAASSAYTDASSTTTATSYGLLADAVSTQVTVTTGTSALVFWAAQTNNNTIDVATYVSYAVTGATTSAAADSKAVIVDGVTATSDNKWAGMDMPTLTAGSNVFTLNYKVISGTATIQRREIIVVPF